MFNKKIEYYKEKFFQALDKDIQEKCKICNLFSEGCNYQSMEKMKLLLSFLPETEKTALEGLFFRCSHSGEIFVISGCSMSPAFNEGDIAIASRKQEYNIGDVIIFPKGEINIVHRVIAKDTAANFYYTKGDNNSNLEKVCHLQVVGFISAIIKKEENKTLWDWIYKAIIIKP